MTRALTVILMCLGISSATAATPPPVPPAETTCKQSVIPLPPRAVAACAKATGDFAYVCAEYAVLYRDRQQALIDSEKKLQQLTRGGVVETLQ